MTRQYSEYSENDFFSQHNENKNTNERRETSLRSGVALRSTGWGGQATLGSIRTHSLRRRNNRRVVNAEQEVGQL